MYVSVLCLKKVRQRAADHTLIHPKTNEEESAVVLMNCLWYTHANSSYNKST